MKTIRVMFVLSTLSMMGGCVVVPAAPGYYPGPQGYYESPPVYYGPSVYYIPSFEFGINRGWGGHNDRNGDRGSDGGRDGQRGGDRGRR